jgi:hypothetical protein
VCNQLAAWDVSYGYIGNVGQVTAKNLLVMVGCSQDITTYVRGITGAILDGFGASNGIASCGRILSWL